MKAIAPAKVILSGEHSVVYGAPALALAVARYAEVSCEPADGACLSLLDLGIELTLDSDRLPALKSQLEARHARYRAAELPIDQVLIHPGDLYLYALALLAEARNCVFEQLHFRLHSSIPLGSGMGSSAATVAALLQAAAATQGDPLSKAELSALCRQAEQLQHGRSSGLDPAVISHGGFIRFQGGQVQPLAAQLDEGWYLIDSGRPEVGTGEVVADVRHHHADSSIWEQFSTVTEALTQAFKDQNQQDVRHCLARNQQLLRAIGVVPDRVDRFVQEAMNAGAAVKLSGAGAHRGDTAGLLLWQGPEPAELCARYGYSYWKLQEDQGGARLSS